MPQYTVIPNKLDASATDATTIDVTTLNKLKVKDTFATFIETTPAVNSLSIVELQAGSAITGATAAANQYVVTDTASVAAGFKTSIVTPSTTAIYDAGNKKYTSMNGYSVANGQVPGSSGGLQSVTYGQRIVTNIACRLQTATKVAGDTSTRCAVFAADGTTNLSGWVAFAANVATLNYDMLAATTYHILTDNSGANRTQYYNSSSTYPANRMPFNITAAVLNNVAATNVWYAFSSFTVSSSSTVVTIALTGITGVKASMLCVNAPDREAGDSITYSLTEGASTDSGLALNTRNNISAISGSPDTLTITLTQKAGSAVTAPSLKSYALLLYK